MLIIPNKKYLKAVTLPEVLIASLILVIAVSSSLWMMVENKKIVHRNSKLLIANSVAADFFEELYARRSKDDILDFLFNSLKPNGYTIEIPQKEQSGNIRIYNYNLKTDTLSIITAPVHWGGLGTTPQKARPAVLRVDLTISFDNQSLKYTTFSRNME